MLATPTKHNTLTADKCNDMRAMLAHTLLQKNSNLSEQSMPVTKQGSESVVERGRQIVLFKR